MGSNFLDTLNDFREQVGVRRPGFQVQSRLVYAGEGAQQRTGAEIVPWSAVHEMEWG